MIFGTSYKWNIQWGMSDIMQRVTSGFVKNNRLVLLQISN